MRAQPRRPTRPATYPRATERGRPTALKTATNQADEGRSGVEGFAIRRLFPRVYPYRRALAVAGVCLAAALAIRTVFGSGLFAAFLAGAAGMAVAATAMLLVSRRPAPIVDPSAPGQPRFRVVEPLEDVLQSVVRE